MNANVVFDPTAKLGSLVLELMPKAELLSNGKRQVCGNELFVLEHKAQLLKDKLKRKAGDVPEDEQGADKIELIDQLLSRLGSLRQPAK